MFLQKSKKIFIQFNTLKSITFPLQFQNEKETKLAQYQFSFAERNLHIFNLSKK